MKYILLVLTAAFTFDSIVMPSNYENELANAIFGIAGAAIGLRISQQAHNKIIKDLKSEIAYKETCLDIRAKTIEQLKKDYRDSSREVTTRKNEIDALQTENASLRGQLRADQTPSLRNVIVDRLKTQLKEAQDESGKLRSNLALARARNSDLTDQAAKAAQLATDEISNLHNTLNATKEERDRFKEEAAKQAALVAIFKKEHDEEKERAKKAAVIINSLQQELEKLQQGLAAQSTPASSQQKQQP